MKKIVFCFSLLFGLNAVAINADIPSEGAIEEGRTDKLNNKAKSSTGEPDSPSLSLDELFAGEDSDFGLNHDYKSENITPIDYSSLNVDEKIEEEAYNNFTVTIPPIDPKRKQFKSVEKNLNDALDNVYNENLSPGQRIEYVNIARTTADIYLDQIDQLIKSVNISRINAKAYVETLKAVKANIKNRTLTSLENEEISLETAQRILDNQGQEIPNNPKIQKQPKPQLNVQRIAALHTNFEALRQALSATNTPIDRINELGDIAFDNVQTTEQVFDYSQYDLSGNKANKGLLMQIQTYYTAAAQLWGTISNTDPSSDEYIVLCDKLRGITGRMNRLIRKVANIPAPTRNLNVLISDIGEYISDFDELNKRLSKTGVRFNYIKGVAEDCFDDDLLNLMINSGMSNQSERQGSIVHDDYLAAKEIWEAIVSNQDNQKALLVNTRKLYNALTKFIPELVELVNQLRNDITHQNH